MERATELSLAAWASGRGLPIGCVIVKEGRVIGEGHNEIIHRVNPTAHAEMVAIEHACRNIGKLSLQHCDIYTTLEPCPMCLAAIYWAEVGQVFFGVSAEQGATFGFSDRLISEELGRPDSLKLVRAKFVAHDPALKLLDRWRSSVDAAYQPWRK